MIFGAAIAFSNNDANSSLDYIKSPYAHLERFSDTKKQANTKANFFEVSAIGDIMYRC
ncbi:MAG: hypothetical protein N2235_07165 [Fischerella sp.]|nr:hypothetical protein [Fischerella sp.]